MGAARGVQGLAAFAQAFGQGPGAGGGVSHLTQGLDQGGVIVGYGRVIVGAGRAIGRAQGAAVEDRQGDSRADAADVGPLQGEGVQPQALAAEVGRELDVWIEVGLGRLDPLARRFGPKTGGGEVGPATHQGDADIGGQAESLEVGDLRPGDAQAPVGPRPQQGGDAVAGQSGRFLEGGHLGLGRGDAGLGAQQGAAILQTAVQPVVDEGGGLLADAQGVAGGVEIGLHLGQVAIGLGDGGRDRQARGLAVDFSGLGLADRGGEGGALAAPEVEVIGQVQAGPGAVVIALGDEGGREAVVVALLDRLDLGGGVQSRGQGCAALAGKGFGLGQTRAGGGDVGGLGQRLVDQTVELAVAIGAPPTVGRPGAFAGRQGLAGGQGAGRERGRALGGGGQGGASGERGGHSRGARRAHQSTTQGPHATFAAGEERQVTHGGGSLTRNRTVQYGSYFGLTSGSGLASRQNCTVRYDS